MAAIAKTPVAASLHTVSCPSPTKSSTRKTGTNAIRPTVRMLAMFHNGTGSCGLPASGPGAAPPPPDAVTCWRGVLMCPTISVAARATVHRMTTPPTNHDSNDRMVVRRARTSDVPEIKRLIDIYAGKILLEKNLVTLYEAVQEFWVAELAGQVVGCGALHVLWSDLGEVRTVAVDPSVKGRGAGHLLVARLIEVARELELERLFVLTFEVDFFARHGFTEIGRAHV